MFDKNKNDSKYDILKRKVENLEKKINELLEENKNILKEKEKLIDTLLISNNQDYLYATIKQYIKDNYKDMNFEYSHITEFALFSGNYPVDTYTYKNNDLMISKRKWEADYPSLSFDGPTEISKIGQTSYNIVYKEFSLKDEGRCKKLFEYIRELKND